MTLFPDMSENSASVGEILEHIAQLLELKGENPFKKNLVFNRL